MARIDRNGIVPTDLTGYVEKVEGALKGALGEDLNLNSETPQGQLAGLLALVCAEIEELAVHVASGLNLFTSSGKQIDDYGTLLNVPRIEGERSSVSVTLTGTSGIQIPEGSKAKTSDNGALFALIADVSIGATGSATGTMKSVELGPIPADVGKLTTIVDAVSGWTAVTNSAAAILGKGVEKDAEYCRRYINEVGTHASESLEALKARVLQVEGVKDCLVRDNSTSSATTVQSISIPAKSVLTIVDGGTDADVAKTISDVKPAGIPTTGTTTVQVPHSEGFNISISFTKVSELAIKVSITTALKTGFPGNGLSLIRQRVVDWIKGEWQASSNDFDISGLSIGESLDEIRLYSPINSVPGHTISSVTVQKKSDSTSLPATLNLNQIITLDADDITFTVS